MKKIVSLIILIIFLLSLEGTYAYFTVIGISPINQNVCLAQGEQKVIHYTLSTNSTKNETFYLYVLNLSWIYTNSSIKTISRTAVEVPFYIIPDNIPQGFYETEVWFCRNEEQINISGQNIRTCLEGNIDVNVSEACRSTRRDYTDYFIIIIIPIMVAMFYFSYPKRRGK